MWDRGRRVLLRAGTLAIHVKSQTDLVGKGNGYLLSRSLSHRVGSAEGTRPEQMWTDQNYLIESYRASERHRNLNFIQAVDRIVIGICQMTSPRKFLF